MKHLTFGRRKVEGSKNTNQNASFKTSKSERFSGESSMRIFHKRDTELIIPDGHYSQRSGK